MLKLVKVKAKVGCDGCWFREHHEPCPVDKQIPEEGATQWILKTSQMWECVQGDYIWKEEDSEHVMDERVHESEVRQAEESDTGDEREDNASEEAGADISSDC